MAGDPRLSESAEKFCRDAAAPPGSTLYYCVLYHPRPEQRALLALFAFASEIDRVLESEAEVAVSLSRLHWWSEEVARIYASGARHPVGVELQPLLSPLGLERAALERCILSVASELEQGAPTDYEAWIARQSDHGQLWAAAARACGAADTASAQYAAATGSRYRALARLLAAFRDPRARAALPAATSGDLTTAAHLAAFAARLEAGFRNSSAPEGVQRRGLLFCRTAARLSSALCAELQDDPQSLLGQQVALTPLRKLWIAWRERYRV